MTRTKLIGVRDPLGVRPLVLGRIGEGWVLSSETCALDIIGAEFVREIEPGEMVVISPERWRRKAIGLSRHAVFAFLHLRTCLFLAPRFHSLAAARSTRRAARLAWSLRGRTRSTLISSALYRIQRCHLAAIGFSQESGIPYAMGIIRNQYMGRTFIEPSEQIRNMGVRLKLNVNRALIAGQTRDPRGRLGRARHDERGRSRR